MGLDMYLSTASQGLAKHMYDWHIEHGYWNQFHRGFYDVNGIIGYWRKANHIHQWMVDHVQYGKDDCTLHEMSIQNMRDLIEVCDRVLEAHDTEVSDVLLPTTGGFFFGSTDYDNYYYEDVEYTKALFEEILDNIVYENNNKPYLGYARYVEDDKWDARISYESSW